MGTDAKVPYALEQLSPDLLVVPESSARPLVAQPTLLGPGVPHVWVGPRPSQGLGVYGPSVESLAVVAGTAGTGEWAVGVRAEVAGVAVGLLGIWTVPGAEASTGSPYLAALDGIFARHDTFFRTGDTCVAGDFNCPAGDDGAEFARFLEVVRERHGLTSAYHRWSGETVGSETAPTHWWRGHEASPFHVDFVLVPERWAVRGVVVGSFTEWGAPEASARSDHAPVLADIHA
jgi:hypothetical protein